MTFSIVRLSDTEYWIENERGETQPIHCLNRPTAETVCIALNRLEANTDEPVRIVLDDKPALSPGRVKATHKPTQRVSITLDGYAVKPDKELTIATKDEAAPAPKEKLTLTL